VHAIREVLRLWVRGEGLRSIERLSGLDRRIVRQYVSTAHHQLAATTRTRPGPMSLANRRSLLAGGRQAGISLCGARTDRPVPVRQIDLRSIESSCRCT
jgi:hypothetical protein